VSAGLFHTLRVVLLKEVLESVRDRRTLMSALLMGPLLGPLFFGVMVTVSLERAVEERGTQLEVAVQGSELAPTLFAWLARRNIVAVEVTGDARALVRDGERDMVLVVDEDYGERLRQGLPARLTLVQDTTDTGAARHVNRLASAIGVYNQSLVQRRMMVRGVSPLALTAVNLQRDDVATPTGRAVLMLGMVSYFLIFATLIGGMYLAIDATAGERERRSLEPLLSLPVPRAGLLAGKLGATILFSSASLAISLVAFAVTVRFIPMEEAGMVANFGPDVVLGMLLVMLPFTCFGACLLTLVASFTRTYREAQTWVSAMMLVPTFPIIFAFLYGVRTTTLLAAVPSLGQHLLLMDLIGGRGLNPVDTAVSWTTTLLLSFLLALLAYRMYQRETIVGG
jgi:sodium transport system permease protein